MKRKPKQFIAKVKFQSLSEEEQMKVLFEAFDILLFSKPTKRPEKTKRKESKKIQKIYPISFLTLLPRSSTIEI